MKRILGLGLFLSVFAGWPGTAGAQIQVPPRATEAAAKLKVASKTSVYCSGFITNREIQRGLYVLTGEEGGVKNEFVTGDVVYLNRGAGWVVNPGGEYMIIRPMMDTNRQEIFPGQMKMVNQLGTTYAEVGRVRADIVHEKSVNATVLETCESISVGDIAIPWNVKPTPELKASTTFDRFAPPTGKTGGLIVAAKEFAMLLRSGDIGYVDVGAKDGVQVGQYFRVYRPFAGGNLDLDRKYRNEYPEKMYGMRMTVHLSKEQQRSLPRDVLGEIIVLHVEDHTATIMVTFSLKDVFVGDQVELE